MIRLALATLLSASLFLTSCSPDPSGDASKTTQTTQTSTGGQSLVLALAVNSFNDDNSVELHPGRLGILTPDGEDWSHRTLEDPDNNVFHKAMAYESEGLISLSGNKAAVKLWRPGGERERLWEADFGGQFSRMRDAEVGDIYGDGKTAIAVATHDQGFVAVLRRDDSGSFTVEELDRQPNTIVHEIEIGDMDGDGVMEVYATPTAPNRVDGTPQPGSVVRYIPARNEGRTEVADLGDRHAKEILVTDIDGDGRDELYVSVEAVSGGQVEIRRYLADTDATDGEIVATLDDKLCRFLTVGDVDGDGVKEMIAATNKRGLWLLHPSDGRWDKEQIDDSSTGFEHASILLDLDGDGRDELYVASDDQKEVRRYDWTNRGWRHKVLLKYEDDLSRFTWNIMAVPTALLPPVGVEIADIDTDTTVITKLEADETLATAPEIEEEEEPAAPRGLITNSDAATPGYVLYAPGSGTGPRSGQSHKSYLINQDGAVVNSWESEFPPISIYLLDNGNLLQGGLEPNPTLFKGGGQAGHIQEFSWDGELLWDWKYDDEDHHFHHDIEPLPNGNVLAIAWEARSAQESSQAGRRPDLIPKAGIWPTRIIEVEPQRPNGGRIVWEWHAWDHLIQDFDPEKSAYGNPSEHPELIDINGDHAPLKVDPEELARLKAIGYVPDDAKQDDLRSDVFHVNAIDYNAELDQIVLSSNVRKEIWIIDHSTTTEEARGHTGGRWGKGGDLLYRWGNPETYGRGSEELPKPSNQHDIQWIPDGYPGAGHLLKFVNNLEAPEGRHSAIYEFNPPTNDDGSYVIPATGPIGPAEPVWKYEASNKTSFHSNFISGTQRLPNGNTFICSGAKGRFMEVTSDGEIVWEFWDPYSVPGNEEHRTPYAVFRATKVALDHPGLAGHELQPLDAQPKTAAERTAEKEEEKSVVPRGLLVNTDKAAPGHVLYTPFDSHFTYLLNKEGVVVHTWENDVVEAGGMYLLDNGNLLRGAKESNPPVFKGGGQGGRIQELSWEGELLWDWKYANEEHLLHHDIEPLPNGNVLAIAWEAKSAQETNQAGRRPDLIPKVGIWPTQIIEIEPQRPNGGRIVWEWHAWDHLVQDFDAEKSGFGNPSEHPELIDINGDHRPLEIDPEELARLKAIGYVPDDAQQEDLRSDVFHVNAIDYNSELDQIVLSSNVRKEIWIIDHSTTTEEARGHTGGRWGKGGDLLYRWGNPDTYGRGSEELPKPSNQHDIQWIPEGLTGAGHLLKFVNNLEAPEGRHSAIYEFIPPTNEDGSYVIPTTGPIGPVEPVWKYEASDKTSFHSSYVSGTQRLPNGHTFICSGSTGRFFEVTTEGEIVWEFWDHFSSEGREEEDDVYGVFRATKLHPDHPGLQGRELQPLEPQPQTAAERKAQKEAVKIEPRGLVLNTDQVSPGYNLFAPGASGTTYLTDQKGAVVHTWISEYVPGAAVYLLDNGNLLRCATDPNPLFKAGGEGGHIQEFSWEGELLWDWTHATEDYWLHHDIEQLPNGNILAIAWEKKSAKEANAAGRRPDLITQAGVWPDKIIEIERQGPNGARIVWEWHAWDHLIQDYDAEKDNYGDPAEHPELININSDGGPMEVTGEDLARLKALGYVSQDADEEDLHPDLFHCNAIDYNADLDQIVLSSYHLSEVFIIDHSTSTEEAAGHTGGRWGKGGDLLYRWGNPKNYNRGTDADQRSFHQHDVNWIEDGYPGAGHLLFYNNSIKGPDGEYSAVYELEIPVTADGSFVIPNEGAIGPAEPIWTYEDPDQTSFYSSFISGARRLPNGNTLIAEGDDGRFFEVSHQGDMVWEFREPFSGDFEERDSGGKYPFGTFRVSRIEPDSPALQGRDLTPLDPQPQTLAEREGRENPVARGLRLKTKETAPGYVAYNPLLSDTTYLLNEKGQVVHTWKSDYTPSGSVYLLDNGSILRGGRNPNLEVFSGGGQGGRIQEIAQDGTLLWDWEYASEEHLSHHDIEPLPNGNVLIIAWESKTPQEASAVGRRPDLIPKAGVWPDLIIEVEPQRPNGGKIVWEWHAWDHLVQNIDEDLPNYGEPSQHPERIDINANEAAMDIDPQELARLKAIGYVPDDADAEDLKSDLFHSNAIAYNAELDHIVISVPNFNEIWIIDHSTTAEEAAGKTGGRSGKGGDLLYRWGNPKSYGRGKEEDQKLFFQHNIHWIDKGLPGAGNLLVFNNALKGPEGGYSAIYEWAPRTNSDGSYMVPADTAFGPAQPDWKYEAPDKVSFSSPFISGTQRLPNGNTLICSGAPGRIFEVTSDGEIVWEFYDPFSGSVVMPDGSQPQPVGPFIHAVFRATKIAPDHPGLKGLDLEPLDPQPKHASDSKEETEEVEEEEEIVRGLRLNSDEVAPGYVLYGKSSMTYLMDSEGSVVHTWMGKEDSGSVYLLDNGNLLRNAQQPDAPVFKGGGQSGRLQEFTWDGEQLWDWKYANEDHLLHHDIAPLPNGNILAIAWESKSAKETNEAGRRPDLTPEAGLWPDMIVEVEPQRPNGGRIVWEWHMWDHLIQDWNSEKSNYGTPSEHPERIDINGGAKPPEMDPAELARLKALGYVPDDALPRDLRSDFLHTNAIDYNAELDQIAISVHRMNEIWIIDHSTTTTQAAGSSGGRWGKGGDLLYRWGNPRIYSRGTEEQQTLFGQHDIRWIEDGLPGAGHLTVFNNNVRGPDGRHSTVLELVPPTKADGSYVIPTQGPFGPAQPVWKYDAPDEEPFHSNFISGARRQPNGNTLICSGAKGRFFEVTSEGKIVWEFWEPYGGQVHPPDESQAKDDFKPSHSIFRATKIPPEHPALAGRDLKPIDPQPRPVSAKTSE